jgi:hypothetical protein
MPLFLLLQYTKMHIKSFIHKSTAMTTLYVVSYLDCFSKFKINFFENAVGYMLQCKSLQLCRCNSRS